MIQKANNTPQELGSSVEEERAFKYSEQYALSTQLKTWMSINPTYGCIWDCGYCIQEKDQFFNGHGKKVVQLYNAQDVVTEIMTNPRITGRTPLTFFNFSDPFLPHNTGALREILTELDDRRFTNPVGLITRTYADNKTIDVLSGLENLRLAVFVSYAGYTNRNLENAPNSKRVQLLHDLHSNGVRTLLYARPLVREWMEEGQLERVRDEVAGGIDGVVMSGIRLTPEIVEKLQSKGLPIPKVKNFTNKYFPVELQEEVLRVFDGVAPVYRYTSCGMSATLNIPDFNAHVGFFKHTQGEEYSSCPLPCKEGQHEVCNSVKIPDDKKIRSIVDVVAPQVDFKVDKGTIVLEGDMLTKQQVTFIRHNTNAHVDYEDNDHHVDQVAGVKIKDKEGEKNG